MSPITNYKLKIFRNYTPRLKVAYVVLLYFAVLCVVSTFLPSVKPTSTPLTVAEYDSSCE